MAQAAPIPDHVLSQLEALVRRPNLPDLAVDRRGRYCYVHHAGQPLCRFGYRPDDALWDFAIYKYSSSRYSNSGSLLPNRGAPGDCLDMTLHIYDLA